ncbi:rod shape-determining protein MreD [Thermostaphylospora chromogena]|uniref:rod shape-determining protein MreD n=1 Tax=Thermostaphylospora chromogena TaxID=35622 RepID=UPI001F6112E5|nr:rod shape-determining protein MreD [Thermostaphylospora chromogena]
MRTSPVIAALIAPVLQVTVVERLPLPGEAVPDLVLAAVVLVAVSDGAVPGMLTGFAAGLAADLVPPADGVAGRSALVLCAVGYACGAARRLPVPVTLTAGVVCGSLAHTAADLLLRDPRAWPEAAELPLALPYTLLSAFLIRLAATRWRTAAAVRRTTDALPARLGAPARDLSVLRTARPPMAGAGRRRRPLRPRRLGGPRAPRGHPGRAWAHRR